MGALKLFVLFAVVSVSLCEEITGQQFQEKPKTPLIETRFKRETDIDSNIRENKIRPKIPVGALSKSSNIRSLKQATKPNVRSSRFVPRKVIVPISHLKLNAFTNTRANKTHKPLDVTSLSNNTKIDNNTEASESIKPIETKAVNSPILEKDGNTTTENEECEKEEQQVLEAPNLATEKEIKDKSVKVVKEEIEKNNTEETNSSALNLVEENKCANLLTEVYVLANTADSKPNEKPFETLASEPDDIAKENIDYTETNETSADIVNKDLDHSKSAEQVDTMINIRHNTLPNFNVALKLLVPKVKQIQPHIKTETKAKEENPINPILGLQRNNKQEDIIKVKNESDVLSLFKPRQIEPDNEIIIQNNIFEELCEPSAPPQYLPPKIMASELRGTPNWNNFNPITSDFYNKYNVPRNYEESNKPYSYEIRKYPEKYVVNTYDGYGNINDGNNFNNTLYTNNANYWNQAYNNYYQPQATCFRQRANFNNYYQGQAYLRDRIWRYWRNSQIIIRPRTGNIVNSEGLFKSINGLANKLAMPIYNPTKVFNSNVYGNENISPYL